MISGQTLARGTVIAGTSIIGGAMIGSALGMTEQYGEDGPIPLKHDGITRDELSPVKLGIAAGVGAVVSPLPVLLAFTVGGAPKAPGRVALAVGAAACALAGVSAVIGNAAAN